MKKLYPAPLLWFFFLFLIVSFSFAQSPEGINYQTIIRYVGGQVLLKQTVNIQFEIINTSTNVSVYKETHQSTTNTYGLINVTIGQGTPWNGFFGSIDWGNGPYDMAVSLDVYNSGNYVLMGQSQLLSVPYALYAKNASEDADWLKNQAGSYLYNLTDNFGIGTTTPSEKLEIIGKIKADGFVMPNGAVHGYVLTTDSMGVATWQYLPIGPTGATGLMGHTGYTGPKGSTGVQGSRNVQGSASVREY